MHNIINLNLHKQIYDRITDKDCNHQPVNPIAPGAPGYPILPLVPVDPTGPEDPTGPTGPTGPTRPVLPAHAELELATELKNHWHQYYY